MSFLLDILGSDNSDKRTDCFTENDSWFEHEGEKHDIEDAYCIECDDYDDDLNLCYLPNIPHGNNNGKHVFFTGGESINKLRTGFFGKKFFYMTEFVCRNFL